MTNTHEKRLEVAGRIYDLDAEVYRVLGSSLGRVFNDDRERTVRELTEAMGHMSKSHYLRSELALISNMARTIPDKAERARLTARYNDIMREVESLKSIPGSMEILDEDLANLNSSLDDRFGEDHRLVISIGWSYGSAGIDIGFALADHLGINYYDTEIVAEVLERLEAEKDGVQQEHASFSHKQNLNQNLGVDQNRSLKERLMELYRYHGLSKMDAMFFNQSDLICKKAEEEDFVIMGRCADAILANNHIPHVSIYISAPFETRVRRVMENEELDYKAAVKLVKKLDRDHGRYYNFYTGREWGSSVNYDLCINSASYGIDGAVQLIERIIQRTGKHPKQEG